MGGFCSAHRGPTFGKSRLEIFYTVSEIFGVKLFPFSPHSVTTDDNSESPLHRMVEGVGGYNMLDFRRVRAKPEVVFLGLTFRARLRSTTMAPFERAWASFAVKVLSDCPCLVPFPRYRRRNFDYVMPKKSSYENVQLVKKSGFMGNFNPYQASEFKLRKYVNEFRGPRQS